MFDIKKFLGLSIKESILIKDIKYNIIAKVKFSNIDEKRDIVRYLIRKGDADEHTKLLEFDTELMNYTILSEFTVSSLFEEKSLIDEYNLEDMRFMVIESIGIKTYNITSYIGYKKYISKNSNKSILIETSFAGEKYFKGNIGKLSDINIYKEKVKNTIQVKMVDEVVTENESMKKIKLFLGIVILIILLLIGISFIGN